MKQSKYALSNLLPPIIFVIILVLLSICVAKLFIIEGTFSVKCSDNVVRITNNIQFEDDYIKFNSNGKHFYCSQFIIEEK